MLRAILQKLLQVNTEAMTLGPTFEELQTTSNTLFPLNTVLVRPRLPKEFGRLAWSSGTVELHTSSTPDYLPFISHFYVTALNM